MRGGPRRARRVLAAVVTALVTVGPSAALAVGPGTPAAAAAVGAQGVSLVSQSAVVRNGHDFTLRVAIPPADRDRGQLRLTIFPMLTTRSGFDQAAAGHPGAIYPWSHGVILGQAGGRGTTVTVRIPVGTAPVGHQLPSFYPSAQSGVYPLQVQLEDPTGASVGPALSTFLVDDAGDAGGAGFHPLTVSVTVPLPTTPAGPLEGPTASSVAALAHRVALLAGTPSVPVTLSVLPSTLAALSSVQGGSQILAGLGSLASGGDEVLPSPFTDADIPSMVAAGLGDQVGSQLAAGAAASAAALHRQVDPGTWVVGARIDTPTVQELAARGLRHLVVSDANLSPLASSLTVRTYGHPTSLEGVAGVRVVSADPVLSARAAQPTEPVLAAEQTLAEIDLTQLELPSVAREVAILPPQGPAVPDQYYETLLAGLRHDPFAVPVTAATLFDRFPATATEPTRALEAPPAAPLPGAPALRALAAAATSIATVVPSDRAFVGRLRAAVLSAPSAELSPAARDALIRGAQGQVSAIERSVMFPGSTSVTLTSLSAKLPLTVFSTSRRPLHVALVLTSPKLGFLAYRPPGGRCRSPQRGMETCQLVLVGRQTTLGVPVEARTSGVFSLLVALRSPDGALRLASERATVRSTAVSSVGLVIIVLACLFLGVWWIRDIRSGRRARQLVRRPDDDLDDGDDPPGGGGRGPGAGEGPPTRPGGGVRLPHPEPAPPLRVPAGVGPPASRRVLGSPVTILSGGRSEGAGPVDRDEEESRP